MLRLIGQGPANFGYTVKKIKNIQIKNGIPNPSNLLYLISSPSPSLYLLSPDQTKLFLFSCHSVSEMRCKYSIGQFALSSTNSRTTADFMFVVVNR